MIGNLLKYTCAKNCHDIWSFDKAIAKIKRCSFLPHMVVDSDVIFWQSDFCFIYFVDLAKNCTESQGSCKGPSHTVPPFVGKKLESRRRAWTCILRKILCNWCLNTILKSKLCFESIIYQDYKTFRVHVWATGRECGCFAFDSRKKYALGRCHRQFRSTFIYALAGCYFGHVNMF